jgi:prephenate dehydrogenase
VQLAFVGLGLIGGSIARSVRANTTSSGWKIQAWSPSGEGPRRAVADGVIDVAARSPAEVSLAPTSWCSPGR